ncbi:MAG: hypothetical protein NTV63_01190 [Candidatus Woesearchaeota archaeon]|nr:hypothetical protein [Candidatus Woesearchaeota archaeon]
MEEFCTIKEHEKGFYTERHIFLSSQEWKGIKQGFQITKIND